MTIGILPSKRLFFNIERQSSLEAIEWDWSLEILSWTFSRFRFTGFRDPGASLLSLSLSLPSCQIQAQKMTTHKYIVKANITYHDGAKKTRWNQTERTQLSQILICLNKYKEKCKSKVGMNYIIAMYAMIVADLLRKEIEILHYNITRDTMANNQNRFLI